MNKLIDRWHCQICGKDCFRLFCSMKHLREWLKQNVDNEGI